MYRSFTRSHYPVPKSDRILTKTCTNSLRQLSADGNFLTKILITAILTGLLAVTANAQIILLQDYQNHLSAPIGNFQGINFREGGLSGIYPIPNTNGKEFWVNTDRGVNVDAANANPDGCHPTYDKIYSFPSYAPKIHRIRLNGDSLQILKSITMKRPDGTNTTGIINPTGFGSTAAEVASIDTVLNCANFNSKIAPKDIWGIDSEGIVVDKDGNFWVCEEGGPTIWKINPNGVVLKRFTPYANLPGAQPQDVQIDSVFKYRKNNRGFEGISITPNGKIYAIIQSPVLYPTKAIGEGTQIHRILEINPADNSTRMFAYVNDGIIGTGANQIRLRDWKIGDMAAINDHTFLVLEAALRGTTDIKRMYVIDINGATPVTSGLYGGKTLEALVNQAGLTANSITPVTKTIFMDLLANGWPAALDKAEGVAILNDSTIAIGNDNDYGQRSLPENGIAEATTNTSHVLVYRLKGSNKLVDYVAPTSTLNQGITGISTAQTPYLLPTIPGANFTSVLTAKDLVNGYKMVGIPDGMGAFDNNNGTFTLLLNHELPATGGTVRDHGAQGAFVSKWTVNKSDLSIASGTDLIQKVYLWDQATNQFVLGTANFARFCSGDLPAPTAFYNSATGLGTKERIYMNGEENGNDGRAFGHIVTGADAGTSYQLPYLGRFSFENSLANPFPSNKTIVAGTDDTTPGQVYMYIGKKTNSGSVIDKAGLNNGKLYGVTVSGLAAEVSGGFPAAGTPFSLVDLGSVQNTSGADLNTASNTKGVTTFLRPEDGNWDPSNPNDFYFVTTNAFTSPSRLWRLRFIDIRNPELGGIVEVLLDGTEGPKMMDNMTIDKHGRILIQEDVGNQSHLGKVWQYSIGTDGLKQVAQHDPARFLTGAPEFLTQDEESSGVIDMEEILGAGKFMLDVQAHYLIPGEVVEGGQLLVFENAEKECLLTAGEILGDKNSCSYTIPFGQTAIYSVSAANASSYQWNAPAKAFIVSGQGTNTVQVKYLPGFNNGSLTVTILNSCGGPSIVRKLDISQLKPETPLAISGPTDICNYLGTSTQVTYSIPAVNGALSYLWLVPIHATIVSGQGTTSIKVQFKNKLIGSEILVQALTACGVSSWQKLKLTTNCPVITQHTESRLYPVPTNGLLTINFESAAGQPYKMVFKEVISGRSVFETSGVLVEGENTLTPDLSSLRNGFYIINIISADITISERIEVRH